MCPFDAPDGRFDDDVNYPGCLLSEPSDGGKSTVDDTAGSETEGMSTMTMVGIIGGVVVLALICVIVLMVNKKPQPKKKQIAPKALTNIPTSEEDIPLSIAEDIGSELNAVDSWEDLPAGDYLDPDENGTVWFKANDGDNWYQNGDGTWTKWQD
jgi:hypothetical protein